MMVLVLDTNVATGKMVFVTVTLNLLSVLRNVEGRHVCQ